jgi:hypothetical protein
MQAIAGMKATTGPPTRYGRHQKKDPCKTMKPATALREAKAAKTIGTSQRQQQKGDPQQQY